MATFHSKNAYLSQSEMQDNANYIYSYLKNKGWTKESICGMLGNMQRESTINPGIWQNLDEGNTSLGVSLVQWTPATNYLDWCTANNLDWTHIESALKRILWELENGEQYYATDSYPESFSEFTKSTKSVTYLASCFLHNYERAGVAAEAERQANAEYWFANVSEVDVGTSEASDYIPRLDSEGMENSPYYYDKNPFHQAGYGLPNCTTYAWGRFWEIYDVNKTYENPPKLSTSDAGNWYGYTSDGYERGSTPKLGAVICWSDTTGGSGHVGIVEEIFDNGNITVSQSGWNSDYFWTSTRTLGGGDYSYNHYQFQGFIYNPVKYESGGGDTPTPPTPSWAKKHQGYKFVLFKKRQKMF